MRIYLKRLQPLRDILELRSTRRRRKDYQRGQASTRYKMRTVFHVNAPLAIVKLLKPVPQSKKYSAPSGIILFGAISVQSGQQGSWPKVDRSSRKTKLLQSF